MSKILVRKPTPEESQQAQGWPVWACEPSRFPWHYDRQEVCLVLEGQATITCGDEKVVAGPGDWVVFPGGVNCIWQVAKPLKKQYMIG